MADKSLSKDQKAAKVKALKAGCMKKAKAAHCKCPKKMHKMLKHHRRHPHPKPSANCTKLFAECKMGFKKIWASNATKAVKMNKTKSLEASCAKKADALKCKHHPHPHKPHPRPPHPKPSANCTALWKGCHARMEKIWHSNMTKEAKWNATKTLKADCMKKSKALNCSGGHHPHPHPPSPGPHPHPPHPSSNCTALWKGCKAAWEKIEHSNMTKEAKMNATKHLKEECMAKAKKMHCEKPHPHHIVMAMMDKPSAECQKIKEGCMAAWKKIMADKSLSKDQKAAKVKALKEACMKKAKAAHCKKMEKDFYNPSAECRKIK
jgi:hypothetical protein